ncbi:MAG: hypothetical protein ACLQVL_34380 [Terriglobia bacterium]
MSKEASEIQHSEFGITGSWRDSEFRGTTGKTPPLRKAGYQLTVGRLAPFDVEAASRRETCSVGVSPAVAGASRSRQEGAGRACPEHREGMPTLQRAGRPRYGSWHGHPGHDRARAGEAVRKSRKEQRYLAQSRKGAEAEKKTKAFSVLNLCVSASQREIIDCFTASDARGTAGRPQV